MEKGIRGIRTSHSIWNVTLPLDEDRDLYIANCYRTSTVSLINTNGEIRNKVPIGKLAIQLIDFPLTDDRLGSPVICGNIVGHDQIFVLDVFNQEDEFTNIRENEIEIAKSNGDSYANVTLLGGKGHVILNADSDQEEGGRIYLNVSNNLGSGRLNVVVNGDIVVSNNNSTFWRVGNEFNLEIFDGNEEDSKTNIRYTNGEGFSYSDQFGNNISIVEGVVNVVPGGQNPVFNIGNGNEPVVLGNTLVDILTRLIQEISISQTTSGPLLNAANIAAFVQELNSVLSQVSNTD